MIELVVEYVERNYPKLYKGKQIMVEQFGCTFLIRANKDESPLILNESILYEV